MSGLAASRRVLVIGSGGREHALAWKLSLSPQVAHVIVAPGNDGMGDAFERWSMPSASRADFEAIASRAWESKIDLVVVGPDNPLADGIVDVLTERGLLTFGPMAAAAQIEASKSFAKKLMKAAQVSTASFVVVQDAAEAKRYLRSAPWPRGGGWVVKADGLALGKGVQVCGTLQEGLAAVDELSKISASLVIEERLTGEEISWIALCDGERAALLDPARDYKRVFDGDRGPNTGGMGAFSPVPGLPPELEARVAREVFAPTLAELKRRGSPFRGALYAGLMWNRETDDLWVIEFNSRFGDPETQVLLPRITADIYPWFEAVARGDLSRMPSRVPFAQEAAVFVVGAARGYPEQAEKGRAICGGGLAPHYFFAAVKREGSDLVSAGGRVLGALGTGATLAAARAEAYSRIAHVGFDGMHFRTDIALKEAAHG